MDNRGDNTGVKVYPIPAHSFIYVKSDEIVSDVIIYGMDGNIVLQKEINASAGMLQVQSLASGTYILKIIASDQSYVRKLLITR
ncbi:MAG: T9SS type A sorting domain-containing protein [Saprospiraceae bacterium]|nr:T9SS type A sorting domain-containing protein [Saprospiraceae bacterium]